VNGKWAKLRQKTENKYKLKLENNEFNEIGHRQVGRCNQRGYEGRG
jgi:hypothetical protein